MLKPLRNTVLAAAAVALLATGGCGGSGNADEGQIKNTVDTVFLSHNVSACTKSVTKRFLTTTYGKNPKKALAACQKSQADAGSAADTLSFVDINIKDRKAIATVKIFGGALNGRTMTAVLVNQGGWRFDTLQAQPAMPSDSEIRKTIDTALRDGLISGQGYKPSQAACFVDYLRRKASDAQLAADLKALKAGQTSPDFTAATAACKK